MGSRTICVFRSSLAEIMAGIILDQQLPRDVSAYCFRFLADSSDLFKHVIQLCTVSTRFRDAVPEML